MKITHLAMHEGSGAGRAALRLHEGLLRENVDSSMLVLQKSSKHPSVIKLDNLTVLLKKIQARLFGITLRNSLGCNTTFSINATLSLIQNQIKHFNSSIINLHWVGWEYLRVEDLKNFNIPLVWTLQDMWAFTGGCHYDQGCDRYRKFCGSCPQLGSSKESDLSHWVWLRKAKAWEGLNLTLVAPSSWMAKCASSSSLFRYRRVEVIPFCLDTEHYQPLNQQTARKVLNLPEDKQLILFGALSATQDKRKGFHLLLPALQRLSKAGWSDRIELVVFGSSQPENQIDLGFKAHYLGCLDDISLVQAYSAADVMIVPSLQESFGQTASESLACGTPVVAFNGTGLKDIVDHQQNGYLAKPFDIEDLATGIAWVVQDRDRYSKLCIHARQKAEQAFSLEVQARRYLSLYNEILDECEVKVRLITP
ncbi:MAG: glycosyltransferase [Moorea sp. SIO3G5]|nr:glycosyltransferase [Moorena sp. SIO3G5]